jgi:hypothetical protein
LLAGFGPTCPKEGTRYSVLGNGPAEDPAGQDLGDGKEKGRPSSDGAVSAGERMAAGTEAALVRGSPTRLRHGSSRAAWHRLLISIHADATEQVKAGYSV